MVPEPRSAYALLFFFVAAILLAVAISISFTLIKIFPPDLTGLPYQFSPAFSISTGLLLIGSGCLSKAVKSVRRERQATFRRWLMLALASGTLFVAVQAYALSCLIRQQASDDASTGAAAFVAVFASLHAMHFVVALLFLCHVTVQAMADRYDHEYYWGVTISAWFWHALGIAWIAILAAMLIAVLYHERNQTARRASVLVAVAFAERACSASPSAEIMSTRS